MLGDTRAGCTTSHARTEPVCLGPQSPKMDTKSQLPLSSLLLILLTVTVVEGSVDETRLATDLLKNYNRNVRPVTNASDTVPVVISLALNQIIDLNEKFQTITSKIWIRLYWNDVSLRWDPAEYGGIQSCRLRLDEVWRPDIELYENLNQLVTEDMLHYWMMIEYDGNVTWPFPRVVRTSCGLNVQYFPWDDQICTFKFGSWTYSMNQLDVLNRSDSSDLSTYITNGEWELHALQDVRHEVQYSIGGDPYSDVTFYVMIRRKPLYYIFNLILPCVFVKLTALLAFVLPPESGEKVSLGVTVLLALTVFLLLVADTLPPLSDSIPLMAQYFGATIILLAASTSLSVVVINIHHRGTLGVRVPRWMRRLFFDGLARILFMRQFVEENILLQDARLQYQHEVSGTSQNGAVDGSHFALTDLPSTVISNTAGDLGERASVPGEPPLHTNLGAATNLNKVENSLSQIVQILNSFQSNQTQKSAEKRTHSEWVVVAYILDRTLLILFLISGILVALFIFYQKYFLSDGDQDEFQMKGTIAPT